MAVEKGDDIDGRRMSRQAAKPGRPKEQRADITALSLA